MHHVNVFNDNFIIVFLIGVSGKMSTEGAHEDDNFGTETSQQVKFLSFCNLLKRGLIHNGIPCLSALCRSMIESLLYSGDGIALCIMIITMGWETWIF